jgi:hypothetical protein
VEEAGESAVCPYEESGLVFGESTDQYDVCGECGVRDDCVAAFAMNQQPSEPEPEPEPEPVEEETGCEACPWDLAIGKDFDQYDVCSDCQCRTACEAHIPPKPPTPKPKVKAPALKPKVKASPSKPSAPKPKAGAPKPKTAPKKPSPAKKTPAASAPAGECPHGMTFGIDCNSDNLCDTCDVWESCQDAKDKLG